MSVLDPEFISAEESETPQLREIEEILKTEVPASDADVSVPALQLVTANGKTVQMPTSVLQALRQIVDYMIHERALRMIPYHQALDIQEAAKLLHVKQQFLVDLLDEGKLPYITVETCKLIPLKDLLAYKKCVSQERRKALAEMTLLSQEAGNY